MAMPVANYQKSLQDIMPEVAASGEAAVKGVTPQLIE
jgi:hypothetical protein